MKYEQQSKASGLSDVQTLRKRAREHVENGAVTPRGYAADRETVPHLLNEALATELVCTLRYRRHYYMADGVQVGPSSKVPRACRRGEAPCRPAGARIVELDGMPGSVTWARRAQPRRVCRGESLDEMIQGESNRRTGSHRVYKEMIGYLGHDDPTTKRLLKIDPGEGRGTRRGSVEHAARRGATACLNTVSA